MQLVHMLRTKHRMMNMVELLVVQRAYPALVCLLCKLMSAVLACLLHSTLRAKRVKSELYCTVAQRHAAHHDMCTLLSQIMTACKLTHTIHAVLQAADLDLLQERVQQLAAAYAAVVADCTKFTD